MVCERFAAEDVHRVFIGSSCSAVCYDFYTLIKCATQVRTWPSKASLGLHDSPFHSPSCSTLLSFPVWISASHTTSTFPLNTARRTKPSLNFYPQPLTHKCPLNSWFSCRCFNSDQKCWSCIKTSERLGYKGKPSELQELYSLWCKT